MKKISPEILVFNPNKQDFLLSILVILLNGIASVYIIGKMNYTYRIFTFIMFTIFITLILFLIASKITVYEKKYSCYLLIVSIILFVRLFFLPQVDNITFAIICIILSIVTGAYASIDSYIKSIIRFNFLKSKEDTNA